MEIKLITYLMLSNPLPKSAMTTSDGRAPAGPVSHLALPVFDLGDVGLRLDQSSCGYTPTPRCRLYALLQQILSSGWIIIFL